MKSRYNLFFRVKDVVDGIKKQQKKWALDQIIESFPEL